MTRGPSFVTAACAEGRRSRSSSRRLKHGQWNGKQILPAQWVAEAIARQTSNGSAPTSDWDQGYGYQFWQSRHGFRGDGAFGQYMLILLQNDAVVAITSGVRDMQAVMNLVWDKLLPAMQPHARSENAEAERALKAKLAGLVVRVAAGKAASPIAAQVSKRWYQFPPNDRGIRAVSLDFSVAPETPFYSTMQFRFAADGLMLDGEMNVSFGERSFARLVGRPAAGAR